MNLINVRHFLEQLLYLCYPEIKASISLGETLCLLAFDMMRPIFLHYVCLCPIVPYCVHTVSFAIVLNILHMCSLITFCPHTLCSIAADLFVSYMSR